MTLAPAQPMGAASLSDNTQAVLLLTSPLLASGGEAPARAKVLTNSEYGQLAQSLLQARHQPADLLNGSREAVLAAASTDLDPDRLNLLLSRGFQLGQPRALGQPFNPRDRSCRWGVSQPLQAATEQSTTTALCLRES